MKKYYLHNGKEKEGPFDLETLKHKNLANDTPIWYEGLADWTIAENVYELKDLFPMLNDPAFGSLQAPPPFTGGEEITEKRSRGKLIFMVILILAIIFAGFVMLDLLDRPNLFK
jgi:hypothetical protein